MPGSDARRDAVVGGRWRLRKGPAHLPADHWNGEPAAPRVLVECDDAAMVWAMERLLGEAGYDVASCAGPSAEATCALAATGSCELQAGADVIVNHLGRDVDDVGSLVQATHRAQPEVPVIVSARTELADGDRASETTVVLDEPWQGQTLLAAIDAAMERG